MAERTTVPEREIQQQILVALSKRRDVRIFRNSVGFGRSSENRPIHFGLAVGSSDLIGIVAPSGRFLALEVKSATGAPTKQQLAFLRMVNAMGGIGRVVRSVDEALAVADEACR